MTRKSARPRSRSHEEATIESLRRDPSYAATYLNSVLEDGDATELMVALRRVADAFGGIPALANKSKLNATTLYRTLSRKGNPELRSMNSMLKALGLRLAIEPLGGTGTVRPRQAAPSARRKAIRGPISRALRAASVRGDDPA